MTRGLVLGLSMAEIAARARSLGSSTFVDGYYQLSPYNGGKDPTAQDPFERWSVPGHTFVNRTADCIGGALWCAGMDRYQPQRFLFPGDPNLEGYAGEINTDSMLLDAQGPGKCFVQLAAPEPGCFVVARTGAPGFLHCGHIATIHTVPGVAWDVHDEDLWRHLLGTDVAMRTPQRANQPCIATWWMAAVRAGSGAFVRSVMVP